MKQVSAKLKSRGAAAAVLTLALGAAVYLNWSFSRGAPPSLLVSDTTADAVETAAAAPVTDQLAVEAAAGVDDLLGDLSSGKNAPKGTTSGSAGGSSPAKGSKPGQGGASQAEIASYISQVQAAIRGHLYDWDTYKGKTCTLRVNIGSDGSILSVKSEGGDDAFCQQMLSATSRMTKFPKPPSQAVYETFKNAPLDFKP